jgi:hypothetical protein
MPKWLKKRNGKFAGSIGDGKHRTPGELASAPIPSPFTAQSVAVNVEDAPVTEPFMQDAVLVTETPSLLGRWRDAQALRQQQAELESIADRLSAATIAGDGAEAMKQREAFKNFMKYMKPVQTDLLSEFQPISIDDLPASAGIYIISGPDACYVGLSVDVYTRFHGKEYGHLQPTNGCRSRPIIDTGEYEVRVIPMDLVGESETRNLAMSKAEIVTYARLVSEGKQVVNAVSNLGRVGDAAMTPVIAYDLVENKYVFFESQSAAQRRLGQGGGLSQVIAGKQRMSNGHTARWATVAEIEALIDKVDGRGWISGDLVEKVVTKSERQVDWDGDGRTVKFGWTGGPITAADAERLDRYRRDTYRKDLPQSGFYGVSYHSASGTWQVRARRSGDSKDFWQTGRVEFKTPLEAAIYREQQIIENKWQEFNEGKYSSNADAINAALGKRKFKNWNGQKPAA